VGVVNVDVGDVRDLVHGLGDSFSLVKTTYLSVILYLPSRAAELLLCLRVGCIS
jgi:hypothetical protein